jgi:hypothetical protein
MEVDHVTSLTLACDALACDALAYDALAYNALVYDALTLVKGVARRVSKG